MSKVKNTRQRDNLLYETLLYTGDHHQPTSYSMVSYTADAYTRYSTSDVDQLIANISPDAVNWISVAGLSDLASLERLFAHFDIDRLWMQDIVNTRHIAKIDVADDDLLAVMDYFARSGDETFAREHIAMLLVANTVVTFQEPATPRFPSIDRAVEDSQIKLRHEGAAYLFNILLSSIVDNYLIELDLQRERLLDIEASLLSDDVPYDDLSRRLQTIRRQFLTLRRSVLPLRGELAHLRQSAVIDHDAEPYIADTHDHLEQVFQMIDSEQALISSIYDFLVTANDQRLNRIVGRLTILSAVFIPLTFMAGVWGMNFSAMPELTMRWGYPTALLSMLVVAIAVVVYFKYKKWL